MDFKYTTKIITKKIVINTICAIGIVENKNSFTFCCIRLRHKVYTQFNDGIIKYSNLKL